MTGEKQLALDANIILRAIFGTRVHTLLRTYESNTRFLTTATCVEEVFRNLPAIAEKRRVSLDDAILDFNDVTYQLHVASSDAYMDHLESAQNRIAWRAPDDAPLLALALSLDCSIWTEDQDFFGCGVVTWNSRNIEIFLQGDQHVSAS